MCSVQEERIATRAQHNELKFIIFCQNSIINLCKNKWGAWEKAQKAEIPLFCPDCQTQGKEKNKSRTCLTCKMRTKPLSHHCHGDLFVWNLIEMGSVWSTFVKILIGNDKDCSIKKALKLNNSTTLTIEQAKNCTCLLYNTHISSIRVTHYNLLIQLSNNNSSTLASVKIQWLFHKKPHQSW